MTGVQYHINPETGTPGLCGATLWQCPFITNGSEDVKHYSSKAEAREAFEASMKADLLGANTKASARQLTARFEKAGADDDKVPYTEDEVYDLAVIELQNAGLSKEGWTIGFGTRTRVLGQCFYDKKQVEFSKLWLPILSKGEAKDTIKHEVAHAIVGMDDESHGHDEVWQEQHKSMGGNGLATYDNANSETRAAYTDRFKQYYPDGVKFGKTGGVAKEEVDVAANKAARAAAQAERDAKFLLWIKTMYRTQAGFDFEKTGLPIAVLIDYFKKKKLTGKPEDRPLLFPND